MKKMILSAIFIVASLMSIAQKNDSVFIYKQVDDMEDEVYYFPSRKIVCSNEDKSKVFSLSAFIESDSDSNLSIGNLSVTAIGFGCLEKCELIIMFDDGTKIKSTSWNKFNCKGNAWFSFDLNEIDSLSKKKITKVKLMNGNNFESYTSEINPIDSDYFIQLANAAKKRKIKQYQGE